MAAESSIKLTHADRQQVGPPRDIVRLFKKTQPNAPLGGRFPDSGLKGRDNFRLFVSRVVSWKQSQNSCFFEEGGVVSHNLLEELAGGTSGGGAGMEMSLASQGFAGQ